MIKQLIISVFLIVVPTSWLYSQPGSNTLHFSLLKSNGKVHGKGCLKNYNVSIFSLNGAKFAEIQDNKYESGKQIEKTGVVIDLGWGGGTRKVIRITSKDDEMWIDIHASGSNNLRLDSVEFKQGHFTLFESDFIDSENQISETINIRPEKWVQDNNSNVKSIVFPENWERWGPTDLIVSILGTDGNVLNPESNDEFIVNISCEDEDGQKFQNQIIDCKANTGGLIQDTAFVANFFRQQYFTILLSIQKGEEKMIIRVYTNWLKSLGLYSIEFQPGNFFIDVDKVLNEDRYNGFNKPAKNHYEPRYNITPSDWETIKEVPVTNNH